MAYAGQVIEHPVTGERIRFLETTADTGGERLLLEMRAGRLGGVAAAHVHPQAVENFEVLSGRVWYRNGRAEAEAGAGERFSIPRGVAHMWRNAGDDDLLMHIEFRPAGRMEAMFENLFGLAADGKTDSKGLPAPFLQLAVIADEYLPDIHLARPPLVVQRALFGLLDPIGRRRGYRGTYARYQDITPPQAPGHEEEPENAKNP